jgi:hypothetical protein
VEGCNWAEKGLGNNRNRVRSKSVRRFLLTGFM